LRKFFLAQILFSFFAFSIWSCEDEPEPEDCAGVEGGLAYIDSCGICDDIISNDCSLDCANIWGGENICGCTDITATNYNAGATFDDGSCEADNSPPTVIITSPINNSTVSEILSIQFSANDNVGIQKTELYSSTGLIRTVNGSDGIVVYSGNWNTDNASNGDYNLYAVAYDLSGNSTTSSIITVSVFNTVTITFNNNCFLPMAFQFGKESPETEDVISEENNFQIEVEKNYGTVTFQGIVSSGCGETLGWDFDFEVGDANITRNLNTSGEYFFINLRNSSNYVINDFYVNADLSTEIGCALDMPNDGVLYPVGYFPAFSNSNARVYVDGESWYGYWEDFDLDGSNNQFISLNFSATALNLTGRGGEQNQNNSVYETNILESVDFNLFDNN
jgi:hypothetical protein